MANILLQEDYSIRTTQLANDATYDLAELTFYVPNKYSDACVYIVLSDSVGMSDIIPLHFIGYHQLYKKYNADYSNSIRIKSGLILLKILLYDVNTKECAISNDALSVNVTIENYQLAHQLVITKELSSSMNEMYEKIVKLTNLNIEMYDKMIQHGGGEET